MSDCQHNEYWATCNCCGRRWWISSKGLSIEQAAPDMLAALKAAHGVIDQKRAPLTVQRIRDAIAKAEGRVPAPDENT